MQSTNLFRVEGVTEPSEEATRDFVCKATRELELSLDLNEQILSESNSKSNGDRHAVSNTLLGLKGLVIYSNKRTLCSNPVLFYGINPGIPPNLKHEICWTVAESLEHFAHGFNVLAPEPFSTKTDFNLIDDQSWPKPPRYKKPDYPPGEAPYQKRVRYLLREIGHPNALVTNLIFLQSRSVRTLDSAMLPSERKKLLDYCWRVHERILEICRPNVVITCTTVVERCFEKRFGLEDSPFSFPARHVLGGNGKDWKCKVWEGRWSKLPLTVIAIPHMSVFDITNPARQPTLERIREIVANRTQSRVA